MEFLISLGERAGKSLAVRSRLNDLESFSKQFLAKSLTNIAKASKMEDKFRRLLRFKEIFNNVSARLCRLLSRKAKEINLKQTQLSMTLKGQWMFEEMAKSFS